MPGPVVIFLDRDAYEPAWMASSLALTARAAGDAVTVVLSFEALWGWAYGRLGVAGGERQKWSEEIKAPDPMRLLTEARAMGARLVACETVVKLTGLTEEMAKARLDDVTGLQRIWKLTEGARVLSF